MTIYSPRREKAGTVADLLKSAPIISELVADRLSASLTSHVFGENSAVDAIGGGVLYQQASTIDVFTRDPIPSRTEGAEYQIVRLPDPEIKNDPVEDIGGAFEVTDEARDRNVRDVVLHGMDTVGASIQRALDERTRKVLDLATAGPLTIPARSAWDSFDPTGPTPTPRPSQPLADLVCLDESFRQEDLGVALETLILNPSDAALLRIGYGSDLPDILAAVGGDGKPVTIRQSSLVEPGTGYALAGVPGGLGVEVPLTTEIIPFRERRTTRVQSYMVAVPYVSRLYMIRKLVAISS